MQEFIVAIAVGCAVFITFILVFLRKDTQGKRGARLTGCGQHDTGGQCDRCRSTTPATILPHPPDKDQSSTGRP